MKTQEIASSTAMGAVNRVPSPDQFFTRLLHLLLNVWRAMTSSRKVAAGSAIVGIFVLVGLFGPLFMRYEPEATSNLFIAHP